ncbi:hypothetical protein PQR05_20310 [Paraburkholderia sediminicola]|uniref:Transposase n=1 Tax=Paraburkholderia metrosideri TaxID=580937 RepID=A0ABW9DV65_9BURK
MDAQITCHGAASFLLVAFVDGSFVDDLAVVHDSDVIGKRNQRASTNVDEM